MIYVVLGMHKSGTTLASQILHHSGVNMGENLENGVSYDQGNQYERESTWRLNEDILRANQQRSIDIRLPTNLQLTPEQQARMRQIIAASNHAYSHWGFKDPRTCLVYPLWASELPEHRLIVIYRDPTEPWPRYRPRHARNRYREPLLAWKYLQSWCEHNLRILAYLREASQPYLVLDYHRLVTTQAEFERLQQFLGMPLVDRRRPSLYR
ncbi:MAG: sulfotransferase, partial [Chloroflexota bacterium]